MRRKNSFLFVLYVINSRVSLVACIRTIVFKLRMKQVEQLFPDKNGSPFNRWQNNAAFNITFNTGVIVNKLKF
jgi:hypothetical protein